MRVAILAALGVGVSLGLLYLLRKRSDAVMSTEWLHRQKQGEREEFHGVSWDWEQLKARAEQ